MADHLSLQDAADALGVHYMTAYRWVRSGRLPATKRGGRLEVAAADVEALIDRPRPESPDEAADRQTRQSNVDRLAELLLHGSASEVEHELARLGASGLSVSQVAADVVTPALQRMTDLWEMGAIDEATVARAGTVASGGLSRQTVKGPPRGPQRGSAAVLMLPGGAPAPETAVLGDRLRTAGWEVHHLGREVGLSQLAVFVDVVPVDVVCVWVRAPLPPGDYEDLARACRGRQVVLVGAGTDLVLAEPLGLAVLDDVDAVADHLEQMPNPGPLSP